MEMAKVVRNWWSHSKTVVLIWSICIAIYFSLLRLALNNSSSLGYTSTIGILPVLMFFLLLVLAIIDFLETLILER